MDFLIKTGFVEMLMPTPEKCKRCGYTGLFPEIEIDRINKFRRKLKRTIKPKCPQ